MCCTVSSHCCLLQLERMNKTLFFGYLTIALVASTALMLFTFAVFLKILICERSRTLEYFKSRFSVCTNVFTVWMNYLFITVGAIVALGAIVYLFQLWSLTVWDWLMWPVVIVPFLGGLVADPDNITAILPLQIKIGSFILSLRHPFGLTGFLFLWRSSCFASWVGSVMTFSAKYLILGIVPVFVLAVLFL